MSESPMAELWKKIKAVRIAMVTTLRRDGSVQSRPLMTQEHDPHPGGARTVDELTSVLCHLHGPADYRTCGRSTKTDDHFGRNHAHLGVEPLQASFDFPLRRCFVETPFAARRLNRRPFEVLDGVRHVNAASVYAGVAQRAVEQLPGRADKWMAPEIFLVTGLLADQHHSRAVRAFAENGLRGLAPQRTSLAFRGRGTQPV